MRAVLNLADGVSKHSTYVSDPAPISIRKPKGYNGKIGIDQDLFSTPPEKCVHFRLVRVEMSMLSAPEGVAIYEECSVADADKAKQEHEAQQRNLEALEKANKAQVYAKQLIDILALHKSRNGFYGKDIEEEMSKLSEKDDGKPYDNERPYNYLDRLYHRVMSARASKQQARQQSFSLLNPQGPMMFGYEQVAVRTIEPPKHALPPRRQITVPSPDEPRKRLMQKPSGEEA